MPTNQPNKYFTFANFIVGRANKSTVKFAKQLAQQQGYMKHKLTLLYGDVGTGKTHLLHAIGNQILHLRPDANVISTCGDKLVRDLVSASRQGGLAQLQLTYQTADLLLIDDLEILLEEEKLQGVIEILAPIIKGHTQAIATISRIPDHMTAISPALTSNTCEAVAIPIFPPELSTKFVILKQLAASHKVNMPTRAFKLIAQRTSGDVRELQGIMNGLLASIETTKPDIKITQLLLTDVRLASRQKISAYQRIKKWLMRWA